MPLQFAKNALARKRRDLGEAEAAVRQAALVIGKYTGQGPTAYALQYRTAQRTLYITARTKVIASELFLRRGELLRELKEREVEIRKIVIR